ncbi:MAG: DUF2865 domain-containing protein [Pseudomonadota bacterium]
MSSVLGFRCAVVRILAIVSIALGSIAASHNSAEANSRQCRALKSELASLSRGSRGNPSQYRRYDQAYKRQLQQIKIAERGMRQNRCRGSRSATCRTLSSTLKKMRSNAASLKSRRDRYARRSGSTSRKRSVERQIRSLGCDRRVNVLDRLRGKKKNVRTASASPRTKAANGNRPRRSVVVNRKNRSGTGVEPLAPTNLTQGYRIMCVRIADGFFFPIGFDTGVPNYKNASKSCERLCPGSETRAFAHRLPDEESEAMRDESGKLYTALPTAFAYLKSAPNTDQSVAPRCAAPQSQTAEATEENAPQSTSPISVAFRTQSGSRTAIPADRPDRVGDFETQMNSALGLTAKMIAMMVGDTASEDNNLQLVSAGEEVRVVLPEFLPDPATAIDLESQGPTFAQ